jgi:hypothetical protein
MIYSTDDSASFLTVLNTSLTREKIPGRHTRDYITSDRVRYYYTVMVTNRSLPPHTLLRESYPRCFEPGVTMYRTFQIMQNRALSRFIKQIL